jgi:hypothetical protein
METTDDRKETTMNGRALRHVRKGGGVVEVTNRTIQGRYLLLPGKDFNEIALGVLGRSQRLYDIKLFGVVLLSNHFHFLTWCDEAEELSDFMEYFTGNLSDEISRLHDWPQTVFPRRYQGIEVSNEPEAMQGRLRYILAHGVKEGIVENPAEWPGVHCVRTLCYGKKLFGYWFDRTQEREARKRGEKFKKYEYATKEEVVLSPLPCWEGEEEKGVRRRVRAMVKEIKESAAAERKATGRRVLGVKAVKSVHPHRRPKKVKRSPAPDFHAIDPDVLREMRREYGEFCEKYRRRSKRWRDEKHNALKFPGGCYPAPLPYVPMRMDPDAPGFDVPGFAPSCSSEIHDRGGGAGAGGVLQDIRGDPSYEGAREPVPISPISPAEEPETGARIRGRGRVLDDAHPE